MSKCGNQKNPGWPNCDIGWPQLTLSYFLNLCMLSKKLLKVTWAHPMSQCGHPKSSQKKADDVNNYLCYLWPLKIKKWPSKQTKKIDARIVAKQGHPNSCFMSQTDPSHTHHPCTLPAGVINNIIILTLKTSISHKGTTCIY
jgi:hypothetical protein